MVEHFLLGTISKNNSAAIAEIDLQTFKEHPWHEDFRCHGTKSNDIFCGVTYAAMPQDHVCAEFFDKKRANLYVLKGSYCGNCGGKLEDTLKPYFTFEGIKADFEKYAIKESFIGICALIDACLVGFAYGIGFAEDMPKIGPIRELLTKVGYDPARTFFHRSSVMAKENQGRGIGSAVLKELLNAARTQNYSTVSFRTLNPQMVKTYERVVGKANVSKIFKDPSHGKDQWWYVVELR